jgi:hypothetical protein
MLPVTDVRYCSPASGDASRIGAAQRARVVDATTQDREEKPWPP